jgi:hypothetical protein
MKCNTLEFILGKNNERAYDVTHRDRVVAATVIQWLGSPVGQSWLPWCPVMKHIDGDRPPWELTRKQMKRILRNPDRYGWPSLVFWLNTGCATAMTTYLGESIEIHIVIQIT